MEITFQHKADEGMWKSAVMFKAKPLILGRKDSLKYLKVMKKMILEYRLRLDILASVT